jgi:hypothetical protein
VPFPVSPAQAKRLSDLARGTALLSLSVVLAGALTDAAGGMRLGGRLVAVAPVLRVAFWCFLASAIAWMVLAWLGRSAREPALWGGPRPVLRQWTSGKWAWASILVISYASAPNGDWLARAGYAAGHIGTCALLAWFITRLTGTRRLFLWVTLGLTVVLGLGSVRTREASERVRAATPGEPPPAK